MTPQAPSPKLTYEDYLLIPDDGKRHQIIDGEHFVTGTPFIRHQRIAGRLLFPLDSFIRERDLHRSIGRAPLTARHRSARSPLRLQREGVDPHGGEHPGSARPGHRDLV